MTARKISIIGGGINGFACGVQILSYYQQRNSVEVTVISEELSPNTTGDGSAGLWGPYLVGETDPARIFTWSKDMHDFLKSLWLSEDAGEAGVCLIPVYRLPYEYENDWEKIVYGCRQMTKSELDEYSKKLDRIVNNGMQFTTYTSEPFKLLPYLMKRFRKMGGKIIQQKIQNIKDLAFYSESDVIINCTGLGARENSNDLEMFSIRGQVSRVKASWVYYSFLDEEDNGKYIIPNCNSVVLGGTSQKHDYNTNISYNDKEAIVDGCNRIIPGLRHAALLNDWVGLRPGRTSVRLEQEILDNGKLLIHNYGHGGCGVTLSWGCASEVLRIINSKSSKL